MEENKNKFKITPSQRLFILLHEYGVKQNIKQENNMENIEKLKLDFETKQKEYFDKFPFNEQAVRDFLACKKEGGYFMNFDVNKAKLSDLLTYPDYQYGFRILNVTVGKGVHNTNMHRGHHLLDKNYDVNEDEVYITYNTQQMMSGGKFTAVMQRKDGKNKIIKSFTHSRS